MTDQSIITYLTGRALDAAEERTRAPELWAFLVQLEREIEVLKKCIEEAAIQEVSAYGKEGVTRGGFHLAVTNRPGRWNFKSVPAWTEADARKKEIEDLAKLAYRTGGRVADKDGVEVTPAVYMGGGEGITATKTKE